MSSIGDSFSKRQGLQAAKPITIWEDAPKEFRRAVLVAARDDCKFSVHLLREVVCKVLRQKPNSNWSDGPVWDDAEHRVEFCAWNKVYDIIEEIWASFDKRTGVRVAGKMVAACDVFEHKVNELTAEFGIGWQLTGGLVQARGDEAHEVILRNAETALDEAGKATALNETREAIADISRRPSPDLTGAITHAMAALECVARDVAGETNPTLGELLRKHPGLLPKPLDQAVEKLWGYASNNARHAKEGNAPTREEAMLIVGLVAALACKRSGVQVPYPPL
jgi:hypothetical protein